MQHTTQARSFYPFIVIDNNNTVMLKRTQA
jgi:hypothetical protein